MVGYKKIIENMVDSAVHHYIWERAERCVFPEKVELSLDNKDLGKPSFDALIKVGFLDYVLSGYVDDYGTVRICSVKFDRMRCTEKDEMGFWIDSSAVPVHEFLWGEKLDHFKFDR